MSAKTYSRIPLLLTVGALALMSACTDPSPTDSPSNPPVTEPSIADGYAIRPAEQGEFQPFPIDGPNIAAAFQGDKLILAIGGNACAPELEVADWEEESGDLAAITVQELPPAGEAIACADLYMLHHYIITEADGDNVEVSDELGATITVQLNQMDAGEPIVVMPPGDDGDDGETSSGGGTSGDNSGREPGTIDPVEPVMPIEPTDTSRDDGNASSKSQSTSTSLPDGADTPVSDDAQD